MGTCPNLFSYLVEIRSKGWDSYSSDISRTSKVPRSHRKQKYVNSFAILFIGTD